jgi:hypothetical protein
MRRLSVEFVSDRTNCGTLTLFGRRGGRLCGPFPVAGRATDSLATAKGNPKRNPLLRYGDTPIGGYLVRHLLKSGSGTQFPTAQFGPHGVIVIEPVSGSAACAEANGRFHFLISGGKLSAQGQLRSTAGGLRLSNEHQRALFAALRGKPVVRCEIAEYENLPYRGTVFVDLSCEHQDPPTLPLAGSACTARPLGRDVLRGGMASAVVFGFTVSFVALEGSGPAQAFTPIASQSSAPSRELLKAQLPSEVVPARSYTKLAYNTTGQQMDSEMTSVVEGTAPPEPQTYASQMNEIWTDAKQNAASELGEQSVEVLKEVTEEMAKADEAANFKQATSLLSQADAEFRVSNYTVASSALEGVSTALALKSAYEKGNLIGNAINDLNAGKITVSEFAQKVGPQPAKLMLGYAGVPFADQIVDAGVATVDAGVSRAIDAGFDLYDRYKGYKGPPGGGKKK